MTDKLREYVFSLDIIDTHEHLPGFEKNRPQDTDFLEEYLGFYVESELVSSGLSAEALALMQDHTKPPAERWKAVEFHWNAIRNTGYARAVDITVRELYGVKGVSGDTVEELTEAFAAARETGNQYTRVLKDIGKIVTSIEDADSDCVTGGEEEIDFKFFSPVFRLDKFIAPASKADVDSLSSKTGVSIQSLADLKRAAQIHLEKRLAGGWIGLKCGLAYQRSLEFATITEAAASEDFERLLEGTAEAPFRDLEDHMMHFVCSLASDRKLPFQIHTGLQAGNGNFIGNSDPTLLANLFLEYPDVRFDLFHIGYPYQQAMATLVKNFPNVFVDFCWAHVISPTAATNALVEFLDSVPANKICGFGGDYIHIDCVVGNLWIALDNIVRALSRKMADGVIDLARAKELAKMILHDNPKAIFDL